MKKLVFLFFILIMMAVTNPSKPDYTVWLKEQAMTHGNFLVQGIAYLAGEPIIEANTTTANYVILSTYTTEIDGMTLRSIGLFNNFVVIENSSSGETSSTSESSSFWELNDLLSFVGVGIVFIFLLIGPRLTRKEEEDEDEEEEEEEKERSSSNGKDINI